MFYASVRNDQTGWVHHGPFTTRSKARLCIVRELLRKDLTTTKGCVVMPNGDQGRMIVRDGWK